MSNDEVFYSEIGHKGSKKVRQLIMEETERINKEKKIAKFKQIAKLNRELFKLVNELTPQEYAEFIESPYVWP